ncbi:MAG: hypothetical protein KKF68_00050 [Nanoarchaeota archaeon]|nr:hypothetical protein [Nanoarchaeota archaeon]
MLSLDDLNPCGYEELPATQCKWIFQCAELRGTYGNFLCASKLGWQVVKFLEEGSNLKVEQRKVEDFVYGEAGKRFVNPKKQAWEPSEITEENARDLVRIIITQASEMSEQI